MESAGEGQSLTRLRARSTRRATAASTRSPSTTTSSSRRRGSTAPRRSPRSSTLREMTLATTISLAVAARPRAAGEDAGCDRPALRRPPHRRRRPGLVASATTRRWASRSRSAGRGSRRRWRSCVRCSRGERPRATRFYALPDAALAPRPAQDGGVPLWIGSWGSEAGLRRVARLADGWLASAYNTTPERFAAARALSTESWRARTRRGAVPELAGDDVDLGHRGSRGGRPRC